MSDQNGIVYIKTDQLDGETDLKPRMVVDFFKEKNLEDILKFEFIFNCKKTGLDEFEGKIREIEEGDRSQRECILDEGKM